MVSIPAASREGASTATHVSAGPRSGFETDQGRSKFPLLLLHRPSLHVGAAAAMHLLLLSGTPDQSWLKKAAVKRIVMPTGSLEVGG